LEGSEEIGRRGGVVLGRPHRQMARGTAGQMAQPDKDIMSTKPRVSIVMGSDSDLDTMREAAKILEEFGIEYEIDVSSAHRSPERTSAYARKAAGRGIRVIIAGAGGAAHLAGVMAAHTSLPVIGVPIPSTSLHGMDSLLATVQMPAGIPVATVAIGKPGAANAGILAAQILALSSDTLGRKLAAYKEKLVHSVEEKSRKLKITLGT
jgi:phosphoribosylaminoimidazole carboxylase PurE protein